MAAYGGLLSQIAQGNQTQFATPADIQQKQLGLQQLANQTKIQQQVQQENALKIQAQQEDSQDDQKFQQIFKDNNGDWDKTLNAATGELRARNLARYTTDHQKVVQTAHELASSENLEQQMKFQKIKANNELIGQALDGVMKAPDELKDQVYHDSIANLAKQGVDVSQFPPQRPPDAALQAHAATVGYVGKILHNADLAAMEDKRKADAQRAAALARRTDAEEAAKDTQRAITEAAAEHMGVTNQAEHDQWLQDVASSHPELADRFKNLTTFNPQTQTIIQNMALTPEERVKKVQKDREDQTAAKRAAVAGGLPGLIARAHDPTLDEDEARAARDAATEAERSMSRVARAGAPNATQTAVQQRYDRTEMSKDSNAHKDLQVKEADAWDLRGRYGDAIARAEASGANDIKDPKTGRTISVEDAKIASEGLKQKATIYQNQSRLLRSKHGWGEFAEGGEDQGEPPAEPSAPEKSVVQPGPAKPAAAPLAATAPNTDSIRKAGGDPSIKQMGGFKVGDKATNKQGKQVTIIGFTKDGKALTQ